MNATRLLAVLCGAAIATTSVRALDGASGDPLSSSLRNFGLAFESRRAPLDVIVVDAMQKAPTEN